MRRIIFGIVLIAGIVRAQDTQIVGQANNAIYKEGVFVQFNWVGHSLEPNYPVCQKEKWMCAFSIAYTIDFKSVAPLIENPEPTFNTHSTMAMNWVDKDIYSDSIPFWIWVFWSDGSGVITDKERKSLCYTSRGFGCLIPYVEDFKLDKPIFATASKKSHILRKTSKDDIIFALALTSDEKFYQVIVFPNMQKILAEITQTKSTKSLELDGMLESRNQNLPINGFIEAKYLPNALKNHDASVRLDPQYKDVRVFDTPPKSRASKQIKN